LLDPKVQQPGVQALPRELSLASDGTLRIEPARELKSLRGDEVQIADLKLTGDAVRILDGVEGDTLELEVTFASPQAAECGVKVLCDANGEGGFAIAGGPKRDTLTVGYTEAPFQLAENEDLTLRIFIDKSMIEVFANGRQAVTAWHEYQPDQRYAGLFAKGGAVRVKGCKAWKLKSIYDGPSTFDAAQGSQSSQPAEPAATK
jgi:beta-fructofuranosidase